MARVILVDPWPRTLAMICDAPTRAQLDALGPLVVHEDGAMPDAMVDEWLPSAVAVLGQTALPAERLERAPRLRAIVNVEGNFLPNVDYGAALDRGVHVLNASPAFALPVAEAALGMAIDLARGITATDRAMRDGREAYGLESNADAFLLAGSPVGIVGFGDLGRALHRLLAPFGCPVKVHDPWLPELVVRRAGAVPAGLDEVLSTSRVIFVFALVTSENEGFLDRAALERIQPGSALLLMSRAGSWTSRPWSSWWRRGACGRRPTCSRRSRSPPTTPSATWRACSSPPTAPAGCARRSWRSAASRSRTSNWCSAACRQPSASAPNARPSAACAAARSDGPRAGGRTPARRGACGRCP